MKTKLSITTWLLVFLGMLLTINLVSISKARQKKSVQVCTMYTPNTRLLAEWIVFHQYQFETCVAGKNLNIKSISLEDSVQNQCRACFDNKEPIIILEPNEFLNVRDEKLFLHALETKSSNAIERLHFSKQDTSVLYRTKRSPHAALDPALKSIPACAEEAVCVDLPLVRVLNTDSNVEHPMDAMVARIHYYTQNEGDIDHLNLVFDDSIVSHVQREEYLKAVSTLELEMIFSE